MLTIILALLFLFLLFLILSQSASILLDNLQYAIKKTKTSPILIGLILGFFTTIPELAVGFNAIYHNIGELSIGNIWGSVLVLFTLVLGLAIIFNHDIKNKGKLYFLIASFSIIILSIILALNGSFSWINGLTILFFYCLLIYIRFFHQETRTVSVLEKLHIIKTKSPWQRIKHKLKAWFLGFYKQIILSLISLVIIIVASWLIIDIASFLLSYWSVSPFLIGLLVFSLGTNLPEISIVIRSALRGAGSLSFAHLVGSAINSMAALGLLSLFHNFSLVVDKSFLIFFIILSVILLIVTIFYISRRTFDRWEGLVLLGIYLIFIIFQLT